MKFFEQAQENFRRSNFFKSLELFELSLKNEPLSREMKLQCCEKIEKINEILERPTDDQLLEFLAVNYFELENFQKAFSFYEKLFEDTRDEKFLRLQYTSLKNSGDVSRSIEIARDYLSFLTSSKLPNSALGFLNELLDSLKPEEVSLWKLRIFIISGDIKSLVEDVKKWKTYKSSIRKDLAELLFELTNHNSKYWHSSKELTKCMWEFLKDNEFTLVTPRKRIIKLMLDYWLIQQKDPDLLTDTLNLSEKYNCTVVGHEIAKYSGDTEKIDYFIDLMPREAFMEDSFDFGDDLFGESEIDAAKKIERDIQFLVKSGRKAEAIKLAFELERLDPDNPLVQEVIERDSTSGSSSDSKKISELFHELQKYTSLREEIVDPYSEYLSLVKHYEDDYIQENYEDMIVGFNLLNLFPVSLEIAKKVDKSQMNERESVNFNYLLIETHFLNGDYYKMRDICEDTLAELPLVKEERVAFLYLRAEAYYFLGFKEHSLAIYKSLAKLHPNYRLTEQRIRTIEAN